MQLDKRYFWDSDFEQIRLHVHKDLIIQRIWDCSSALEEIEEMVDYYGEDVVVASLMDNTELSSMGSYFAAAYFDKDIKDFKCYIRTQSSPIQSPF
jgi:hypothetical protein